ncbi:MAG: pyridoxal phosphate-dependent aminotransferase, partial [Abditibacteriales bacterium]|nr:pyridoxal phosphate-dependent aminotransferase [Abditibacteriales bacterium]MDW8368286.1 pyridoxal phosphate-dependent aminotransferase [Abditibacteriales bacterium]
MKPLATRMSRLGTETAFEVLVKARTLEAQGHNVIHLEIGEPDFDTPRHIRAAAAQALEEGYTHYGPAAGLPELRQAIADEASAVRGVTFAPEQVVITPGAKPIMFFAILALVDEGDEAIYPDPGFPIYESMIRFVGGKPVPIPLREELDFRLDVDELRRLITSKTKLLILNSPQNPTGGVLTAEDIAAIADLCREHDIAVLSDEVYRRILYDGTHHSIASLDGMKERTIILDGFSKTYAMTGWRLGYGIMPEKWAEHFVRLQVNSTSCTATFIQRAGIAALNGPQEEAHRFVAEFRRRRDLIVEGLNRIKGVSCKLPQGAFYVFPNVKSFGRPASEIADLLLYEGHVATLSGTAFGRHGEG